MSISPPEQLLSPSLSDVLDAALYAFQEDLHTCAWGQVVGYDAASQTASVQLAPRAYIDADGVRQSELPTPLTGVPVIFPGSGVYSITFPVQAGDQVLVVFGEHAFDGAASGQVAADVGDDRRHSLSDAVCIPGLRSKGGRVGGAPPSDALVVNAPKIQLGSKNAAQQAVLGTGYRTAEDQYLALLEALLAFVVAQPTMAAYFATGAPASALSAWTAGITAFHSGASGYLSTKVEVE